MLPNVQKLQTCLLQGLQQLQHLQESKSLQCGCFVCFGDMWSKSLQCGCVCALVTCGVKDCLQCGCVCALVSCGVKAMWNGHSPTVLASLPGLGLDPHSCATSPSCSLE